MLRNLLMCFLLLGSQQANFAQSFETQILNKEQFKSAASLTQDYDDDGDLDIIVTRWDPAGIYLLENDGTKQFPHKAIITEDLSFYMADIDTADFNRDGLMDYVVCFTGVTDGELAWFQRIDDCSYLKWTIATNKDYIMADVADFNGDGWPDVAAVGLTNSDNKLRVYINQGNLFFEETLYGDGINEALDAADIDGDGDIDIAVTGNGSAGNSASPDEGSRIFLNDGNGNFTVGTWLISWSTTLTSMWDHIMIVDLDNNGSQDVLGVRGIASSALLMFDGSNNYNRREIVGGFDDMVNGEFILYDFDGNGLLDIVFQRFISDKLAILYQESPLVFREEPLDLDWDTCCNPTAKMSLGDLDNDGDMDLVFPEQGNVDEDISWYENINGKLYKHQIYGELYGIQKTQLADWDKDGDLDIFATVSGDFFPDIENELIMYENIDGENFVQWRIFDSLLHAQDLAIADIDGDADLDIFATARDADDLIWLRNDGFPANWVADTIFPEANQPSGVFATDIDDDGDQDVILASENDEKIFGFKNNGAGKFNIFIVDTDIANPKEVEVADIDNDGDKDIVAVGSAGNTIKIYLNDGSENFSKQIVDSLGNGEDLEIVDWNQDGKLDIWLAVSDGPSGLKLLLADDPATGAYTLSDFSTDPGVDNFSLQVEDMDEDGDPDLIAIDGKRGGLNRSTLSVFLNQDGNIVRTLPLSEAFDGDITGLAIGDVNDDGQKDIVMADFGNHNLNLITIKCLVGPAFDLGSDTTLIAGESLLLDPNLEGNFTYEWSTGDTSPTLVVSEAGTYTLTATNEAGCSSTSSIMLNISTGVQSSVLNSAISIFPNPAKDKLVIKQNRQGFQIETVSLLDLRGREVFAKDIPNDRQEFRLELDASLSGLYLLQVKSSIGTSIRKLMIH